jgi:hypothetical protein
VEVVFGYLQDPSRRLQGVRVHEVPSPGPAVCRCGTHIPAGAPSLHVSNLPGSAEELFHERSFCTVRCLRAFCLETLETLDPLDTPEAQAVVSDLHALHQAVATAFAEILAKT